VQSASRNLPPADPSFDENRAAAFLDKIMAYHRPAAAARRPGRTAAAEAAAPVQPLPEEESVFASRAAEVTVPLPRRKPVMASVARREAAAPVQTASAAQAANAGMTTLPDEEPAAAPAPVRASADFRTQAASMPVVPLSTGAPVTLEKLLADSGVQATFKSDGDAGGTVRQWSTGKLNGMYEQLPPGDFLASAEGYLDRYRQDCPENLDVSMGKVQTTEAGTFAQATVSCPMPSNSYTTSFVFVQDSRKFGAILHTGYPDDGAKLRNVGDNIASALGTSGGLLAGGLSRKAEAAAPRRFNIRQESAAAPAGWAGQIRPEEDIDTVVVQ
jgi:hypothetical protein